MRKRLREKDRGFLRARLLKDTERLLAELAKAEAGEWINPYCKKKAVRKLSEEIEAIQEILDRI